MNKMLALLLTLVLGFSVGASGIAESQTPETEIPQVYIGELTMAGFDEGSWEALLDSSVEPDPAKKAPMRLSQVFFDNLNSLVLALQSGRVTEIGLPSACANYFVAKNPGVYVATTAEKMVFELLDGTDLTEQPIEAPNNPPDMTLNMAVTQDNQELIVAINEAIAAIKADGTMDSLLAEHVDAVIAGEEPEAVVLPNFDGAKTIRVVVTGDLPPYDYVTANGVAAGFNVALLAEIANRKNINFELVMADAGSRAPMLTSGRADVIFWIRTIRFPAGNLTEAPAGLLISEPYITENPVPLILAK